MRLAVILLLLVFASCGSKDRGPIVRQSTVMETFVNIAVYDNAIPPERINTVIDSVFWEMSRIEGIMTDYSDTSQVGRINTTAGRDTIPVCDELAYLIGRSLEYSLKSDGRFDISIGPLVKGWDFLSSDPRVPTPIQIRTMRRLVDYRKVNIKGNRIWLASRAMRIDLGAIAKGFAVDRSLAILARNGISRALVDLGGNLGVVWDGKRPFESDIVEILIRHPRKPGKFFGSFRMGGGGVSTSGDYQRYFVHDGIRYHHILDPTTGYPAKDVVSVTIIADDATTADALSTMVFVLGKKKGMDYILSHDGVEGMIVWEEDGQLRYELSPGLINRFVRSND